MKIRIGLDIDGTITENPKFFAALTQSENYEVYLITGRDIKDHLETMDELAKYGIRFDGLRYADKWEDKAQVCKELDIQIMFDDQDEYIAHLPPEILVFKPRNGGNWNEDTKRWMVKPPNSCADKSGD